MKWLFITVFCVTFAYGLETIAETIFSPAVWRKQDSPIQLIEPVVVSTNAVLHIEAGVTIRGGRDTPIIVYGSLMAEGTEVDPILFTGNGASNEWPGVAFIGERIFDSLSCTGVFSHCRFDHGVPPDWPLVDFQAAISARFANLSFSNCSFETIDGSVARAEDSILRMIGCTFLDCGEGINAVRCDAQIVSNHLSRIRNGDDAIDIDLDWSGLEWRPALVEANIVDGGSGDGIDLGSTAATVRGNLIRNCADKGISIGEGSNGRIENNVVLHCRLGMAIKDSSAPVIANNTVAGCEIGINCYEKDLGMGGARGHLLNSIVWGCDRSIVLDDLSLLDVRYSIIEGERPWPGAGNRTNDPLFVKLESNNVLLQAGSPALHSGNSLRGTSHDFHGTMRANPPTRGAFEDVSETFDSDGDTVIDSIDLFPFHPKWQRDGDGDGLPDEWEMTYFQTTATGSTENPDRDEWSNLEEFLGAGNPTNAEQMVVINEMMYCPESELPEHEFIELVNHGSTAVIMDGWQLCDEVQFDFPAGTILRPGEYLVIAASPEIVEIDSAHVVGPWTGALDDDAAVVRLVSAGSVNVDTVEYRTHTGWPVAGGTGSSIELMRATADNNVGESWVSSLEPGGTPGERNSRSEGEVVINEFLASSAQGVDDWIELFNQGAGPEDISGWFLSNQASNLTAWAIPPDTILGSGEAIFFSKSEFEWDLSHDGGRLYLTRSNGGSIESVIDYGEQWPDVTQGRYPDGYPSWAFYTNEGTPGASNGVPFVARVVINEVMYHPASENEGEEYIELYNLSGVEQNLTGWQFTDGISYAFPPGSTLAPDQYLVIAHDPLVVSNKYDLADLFGPFFTGRLSNRGERLELRDALGNIVDSIHYQDRGRWPRAADGDGPSLELLHPELDNTQPESWRAHSESTAEGTPGSANAIASSGSSAILAAGHYPVTPAPSEAVTVRARVEGAAVVRLVWKRDQDSSFNVLGMMDDATGNKVYTAEIPPQAHRTLMEYYIEAEDANGGTVAYPFGAPSFHLSETGHEVPFTLRYLSLNTPSPSGVPRFRVLMSSETRQELEANMLSDQLLPVTLIYMDEVFPFARLRYRGMAKRLWTPKSYRIDLGWDHPLADRTKLDINGKRPGPEWLATEYCRQRGLAPPLQRNIQLHINAQNQGPYLFAERIGQDYLDRNFPGASDGVWVEGWGETISNSSTHYPESISNRLVGIQVAHSTDDVGSITNLIDPEQWLRWLTCTVLLGDSETLLSGISGNHSSYLHPQTGQLLLEPLDLDITFYSPNNLTMNLHVNTPSSELGITAVDAFMHIPYYQRRYYQALADELDTFFTPEKLTQPVSTYFSIIDPRNVIASPQGNRSSTLDYLENRRINVDLQLSNQVHTTTALTPEITTAGGAGIYWWPYRDGWIEGRVVPGTAAVSIDSDETGITLDQSQGTWTYTTSLPEGNTVVELCARSLSNRPYCTTPQTITLRYDSGDDDGDSLPNSWELFYGLDPAIGTPGSIHGADGDPDGDGVVNSDEYAGRTPPVYDGARTPPTITWFAGDPTQGMVLIWSALSGTVYRVESIENLLESQWQPLNPAVTATSSSASAVIIPEPESTHRFYRIKVIRWPTNE